MTTILLALVLGAAPPEFTAQPLDGKPVVGKLVSLDAKQVVLETPTGRVTLELEKLMGLSPKDKPAAPAKQPAVWVELTDGSKLAGDDYTAKGKQGRLVIAGGEAIEIPTAAIATVRFQQGTQALAAEWTRILAKKVAGDLLITAKGDSADYHSGAIQDVTDKVVQFSLEGESLNVKREKIFGLVYYHAQSDLPEATCQLTDAAGCTWAVKTFTFGEKLQWTTPSGVSLSRPLEQVANLNLSGGKIVYLSDIAPESSTYTPFFALAKELPARLEFFRPRQNQNLEAKKIRFDNQTFEKGLAMHSRTEMVFYLPAKYSRFEAVAGIDQEVRPRGSVRLVVRGDTKVLYEATIAGTDAAKPLNIDITGVRRLTILADFTEDLDVAGHLDLGNARVIK